MNKLSELINLAYQDAKNFRDKLNLDNYCAGQLLKIIDRLQITENVCIKLIRTPFKNIDLSGFIGYKKGAFIIVTNTNHKLGSERFTIAHEIYHLLSNRTKIKEESIIEELEKCSDDEDTQEIMANAFAAELLMPEEILSEDVNILTKGKNNIDESIIVELQQKYGVSYVAMTKRLNEIGLITKEQCNSFEIFEEKSDELEELTKNLGYTNELNIPSRSTYLGQNDLQNIRVNYKNGDIDYDDLVRIFSYLGCEPEKFGYYRKQDISDDALEFMKALSE